MLIQMEKSLICSFSATKKDVFKHERVSSEKDREDLCFTGASMIERETENKQANEQDSVS